MSANAPTENRGLVDPRDRRYIDKTADPRRRDVIACTVATYRRPDRLAVGDPVPPIELARLEGDATENLGAFRGRPLVLFFGSYT